ncbi:hypothetical protein, partial [Mesorhizobium sp. M7A.F.Ca.US.006.04.2.1]|uniref:hypothetical protein n=1 Tax=Mesorhizobium sp. M7A.F.Ca.US.006.04.2.1 TaxID=2496696 RepID=UPI0019D47877
LLLIGRVAPARFFCRPASRRASIYGSDHAVAAAMLCVADRESARTSSKAWRVLDDDWGSMNDKN